MMSRWWVDDELFEWTIESKSEPYEINNLLIGTN